MEPSSTCLDDVRSPRILDAQFTDFVRANVPVLARKAYSLTGSGSAAEELVQDTLVRLYPRWARVEETDVPLAYVQRSLTNNFLNQQRRDTHREIATDDLPDRPDRRNTEGDIADRDHVWGLLDTLSQRQRTVLVLRFYEGLSDCQIADHLGCRAGTVRSLTSRALATLRQRLQPA